MLSIFYINFHFFINGDNMLGDHPNMVSPVGTI